MVPSTVAPTQQESLGSGISSEAEIVKTLLPNPDQDTEMADARGKNVLHHSCSSSAEDDSPLNPPKKRASPNRHGKAPPHSSTGTDQLPRSLRSGNTIPHVALPPAEALASTPRTDNHSAVHPTRGPVPMVVEHQPLPAQPPPPTPPTEDQPPLQPQWGSR